MSGRGGRIEFEKAIPDDFTTESDYEDQPNGGPQRMRGSFATKKGRTI